MNNVDEHGDGILWAGDEGSDLGYDSDDLSDSDGSEGEVPDVNDVKAADFPGKTLTGAGAIRASPNGNPSWSNKSSTIATQGPNESSLRRDWKVVVDGKVQAGGETEALRVRGSSIPAPNGPTSAHKNGNESDSDVRRVPEMVAKVGPGPSGATSSQPQGQPTMKRKRGGASADKEHKRLKRLLRNRVSAQQARERKKAYLSDLEVKAKEHTRRIDQMEEKISTLTKENAMLRQLLKTSGHMKKNSSGLER